VWVASKKVHGANLCIGTDGTAIEIAKRRVVLASGEPFFAYEHAIGPLVPAVRRLARALGDAAWVLIYRWLAGATGRTVGLLRTAFVTRDRFGIGRNPAAASYRAHGFSFSLLIEPG
jgi:hypothetical protein